MCVGGGVEGFERTCVRGWQKDDLMRVTISETIINSLGKFIQRGPASIMGDHQQVREGGKFFAENKDFVQVETFLTREGIQCCLGIKEERSGSP